MSTAGKQLLSAIVSAGDLKSFITMGLDESMFKESENVLFKFIKNHVGNFGVIPSPDTIEDKVGDVLVQTEEPVEYYFAEVERRFLHTRMKSLIVEAGELLKTDDPEKAYALALAQMMELSQKKNRHHLFDFKEAGKLIHQQYMKQKAMPDETGIPFGLPSLDAMTGGLQPGDFCSIVGRPAMGKTFQLLSMAHHGWAHANQVPFFDSLEMGALVIQQRLAAMNAHKNLTHLIKGMMTTKAYMELLEKLNMNSKMQNSFWVADSNLSGDVDQVVMMCRQLKPSACYVDAAYLLEHPDRKLDKFGKIAANAELLKKRVASDLGIPVVASYQLNRGAVKGKGKGKKEQDEEVGIEDIYGTDVIGQISSVVLGLLQAETVETKLHREISVLKGRNGETGKIKINWDFKNMDFSEVTPEAEQGEELQFLG